MFTHFVCFMFGAIIGMVLTCLIVAGREEE